MGKITLTNTGLKGILFYGTNDRRVKEIRQKETISGSRKYRDK